MRRLRWRPQAERDLEELWVYIARRNPQAADHYLLDILTAAGSLRDHSRRTIRRSDIHEDAHALVVRRHLLLYCVREDEVIIVRVYHGSRDVSAVSDDFSELLE